MPAPTVGQKGDGEVPPVEWRWLTGIGLHSGLPCALGVRPGPAGSGLRLDGAPIAGLGRRPSALCTTLDGPRGPVATVEHLLAACAGLGVADAELAVEGGEVPAVDGSAAPLCAHLLAAGLAPGRWATRPIPASGLRLARPGGAELVAVPLADDRTELVFEGRFPGLGEGRAELSLGRPADAAVFLREIAPARTFGYIGDWDGLRAAGLALGASAENSLGLDAAGQVQNPGGARFPDEPFRHKLLDLLGDLALAGVLPRARVVSTGGGHALNAAWLAAWRATWRA